MGRKKYELLHSHYGRGSSSGLPEPLDVAERELVERRRDGADICVHERTRALEHAGREPLLVRKMLDISDRVRAETALRESEAWLAIAPDPQQLGISHWDIASGQLEWSPGSEQRLGLEPGSLASFEQWQTLVEPKDMLAIMDTVARVAANHDMSIAFQYHFRAANGVRRTIEGSGRCIYDSHGELGVIIATNIDVTERSEREAAEQLRSILETIPDAVIVIDESGTIKSFSATAERMFDRESETVIGGNIKLLMPDNIAAGHDASLARYLVTGERHVIGNTRELTARRADGSLFPIEVNIGEAWLGGERIFTGVIRDVSDRLAAEQRLGELNAELAHISRQSAMSELAADLAHELNQPLSATANFLAAARMLHRTRREWRRRSSICCAWARRRHCAPARSSGGCATSSPSAKAKLRLESIDHVVREAVELVFFGTRSSTSAWSISSTPRPT